MAPFENVVSPESQGLSSEGISRFILELKAQGLCTHGIMIMRNGKCVAKAYEPHFNDNRKHRMYSVSKTFVSAAVGALIDEGRLSLDDKIVDFFPDKLPENLHPYIAAATVRDLLMMATPFSATTYHPSDKDWAKTFFVTEPSHMPGTIFNYDTSGTYILDTIVERITGKTFLEYLYEKALRYIGFSDDIWCVKAPEGNSWGGSGVMCTLPELSAFAQLFMDKGRAPDGTQLISEEYITAATTAQMENEVQNNISSSACHGYGYQVWITRTGFAFLGMGNQLAICEPEKGICLTIISDDQGNGVAREIIFRSFRENVVDTACDNALPENADALAQLRSLGNCFSFPAPKGEAHSALETEFCKYSYAMDKNPMDISRVRFAFDADGGRMILDTPRGERAITFGAGFFDDSVFPETHYFGDTIGTPSGKGYECHTCGAWANDGKLVLRCYLTDDYFGNLTITVSFKNDTVNLLMLGTAEWFLNEYRGFACGKAEK